MKKIMIIFKKRHTEAQRNPVSNRLY